MVVIKRMRMKRIVKILGIVLLVLLVCSCLLPYAIPLSRPSDNALLQPYSNSAYLTIDEVSLHFRLFQPVAKDFLGKILFVHGLGGSTYSYEKTAPALAEAGYLVVAVDLPLFGYSQRLETFDHSQANRSRLLWDFLDALDARLPLEEARHGWHLAGHSMGGGTVAAMAAARQQRTASLILIDGALFETSRNTGLVTFFPPVVRWLQIVLEKSIIREKNIRSFLTSAYGKQPTDADVAGYLDALSVPGTALAVRSFLKTSRNLPVEELRGLSMPALAIWGSDDTWVPFSDTQRIKEFIPQLEIRSIAGAGHIPMETHPAEFNQVLLNFLLLVLVSGTD
jgi:pimeloyl-ACP methyl ester carboxylesterase